MIAFNEDLLERVRKQVQRLPKADGSDVEKDVSLIADQLERYRRRLDFWYERQWQLEGLQIDPDDRTVTYRDRAITLTRREYQLFMLLVSRSPSFISPSRLLVEAWHDGQLPEETLRTYVGRLRGKLASLGAAAEIRNQPRRGYAMVFSETATALDGDNQGRFIPRGVR
jgi:DNA-binding response OmpR family regulator